MRRVAIQRVYDGVPRGGTVVLVDRVWPRGISKERLAGVEWFREIGPSDGLRAWFGHRPERWDEFQRGYRAELEQPAQRELLERLTEIARSGSLTLLFSARDTAHNQAVVIREAIESRLSRGRLGRRF